MLIAVARKEKLIAEIIFLCLSLLCFIFRTAFPYLKYPFLVIFAIGLIYFPFIYRDDLIPSIKIFSRKFFLILVQALVLVSAFIFSDKYYLIVFKDVVNAGVILAHFFLLYLIIRSVQDIIRLVDIFVNLVILFGVLFSFLGLGELFNIISFNDADKLDYNFALLPVFFGIISLVYKISITKNVLQKLFFAILSFFCYFQILLSGSRRGMILLIILIIVVFGIYLLSVFSGARKKSVFPKSLKTAAFISILTLTFTAFSLYMALFGTTFRQKENTFEKLDLRDELKTKYDITYNLNRYISVIPGNLYDFPKLYSRIWSPDLDMKDPDTGWGTRIHKTVFPLVGPNSGKIPYAVKGYMMDSTCDASYTINQTVFSSTTFEKIRVNNGDKIDASVFCFISDDFNGDSVRLSMEGSVSGKTESYYNTYKNDKYERNQFQNLIYNGNFKDDTLYWENYYALTTKYEMISTPYGRGIRISRTEGDEDWSLSYTGRPIIYYKDHEYKFHFFYRVIKGDQKPFNIGWWIDDGNQGFMPTLNLPMNIKLLDNGWYEASCSYKFRETHTLLMTFLNSFRKNSIVEIADIKLYDLNNNSDQPTYLDEVQTYWQKLSLRGLCTEGHVNVSMIFSKENSLNFKDLKGHVIFAFPQINIIKASDKRIIPAFGEISNIRGKEDYIVNDPVGSTTSPILAFSDYSGKYPGWLKQENLASFQLISFNSLLSFNSGKDSLETDPIRRFTRNFISEDTTYHALKSTISTDSIRNPFIDPRIVRWKFALKIYSKEYGLLKKIFGGGFNHLNWFGYHFSGDGKISDYPHNPLLSVLLYSGLFGLVIYIVIIVKSVKFYLKYFDISGIIFLFFIITSIFSFFSSGGAFDPPVMAFFIILPHLIHNVLDKTKS